MYHDTQITIWYVSSKKKITICYEIVIVGSSRNERRKSLQACITGNGERSCHEFVGPETLRNPFSKKYFNKVIVGTHRASISRLVIWVHALPPELTSAVISADRGRISRMLMYRPSWVNA